MKADRQAPIGVFDSGVGGLKVGEDQLDTLYDEPLNRWYEGS